MRDGGKRERALLIFIPKGEAAAGYSASRESVSWTFQASFVWLGLQIILIFLICQGKLLMGCLSKGCWEREGMKRNYYCRPGIMFFGRGRGNRTKGVSRQIILSACFPPSPHF